MGMFEPIAALGSFWVFVINLACTIIGGGIAIFLIVKILRRILKKSNHADDAMSVFVVNAIKVVCMVILITIVLQLFGVGISTIVAVVGTAGAAIALALRDSLANIAGGFMILVTHPFNKGDLITIGTDRGYVEEIDLFLTTLRTLDYQTVTIPNGLVNTSVVYNETNMPLRRAKCQFTVSYDADIDRVKALLEEVCARGDMILEDPEPVIGIAEHGESGIVIDTIASCLPADKWKAEYYLKETVKKTFDEAGIEIPYPHVELTVTDRK